MRESHMILSLKWTKHKSIWPHIFIYPKSHKITILFLIVCLHLSEAPDLRCLLWDWSDEDIQSSPSREADLSLIWMLIAHSFSRLPHCLYLPSFSAFIHTAETEPSSVPSAFCIYFTVVFARVSFTMFCKVHMSYII